MLNDSIVRSKPGGNAGYSPSAWSTKLFPLRFSPVQAVTVAAGPGWALLMRLVQSSPFASTFSVG
jgi:hypothetical protein